MTDSNQQGNQDPNLDPDNTGLQNESDVKLTDDELALLDEETSKKIKSLQAQKTWWREKAKKASDKVKELETKSAPVTPPVAPVAPSPQVDVEIAARKVAMDMKREEFIGNLPEDKRQTVTEFFSGITAGKELTVLNFNDYMGAACRAAGIEPKNNSAHRITSASGSAVPPTGKPGPTQEQIEMAKKADLNPNDVYGDKVDFSNMLNAHKFVGEKKDEFI